MAYGEELQKERKKPYPSLRKLARKTDAAFERRKKKS
jgi:hypothetical protein